MSKVTPRVLKGFRDYLPDVMAPKEAMLRKVAQVFESFGFAPLSTPALEYTEILTGKYGTEGDQLLYRFRDNGDRDVSLRYDLTVPLARVIGQHTQLLKPFRRYQIAPVWRAEKPARGRFREFIQCDVDIVGSTSLLADFECIQVGVAALKSLGVNDFRIHINDRRVLEGLMERLGADSPQAKTEILRIVDKLAKIGWDGVTAELATKVSWTQAQYDALHTFLHCSYDAIDDGVVNMQTAEAGLESINTMLGWAESLGIREHLDVDLSIARGLDYYTSTVYETFLTGLPGMGAVMSGGRYDGLLSLFSKQDVPAVGISLGVDRLLAALIEMDLVDSEEASPDVFVTIFADMCINYSMRVASMLREGGISAQLHLNPGQKMGKQFNAADRIKASIVVVAGPDEYENQQVTVKDLRSGEQASVALDSVVAYITERLGK